MKLSGELLAILSAIFIGIAIPLSTQASKGIGAFQMAIYSCLLSSFFLLLLSLAIKESIQARAYLKKYSKEAFLNIISRTILGNLLFFYGVSLTAATHAAFMLRLEPIFVILWSYVLLKERISLKQLLFVLFMIFGAFLFSTGGNIEVISQIQIGDLIIAFSLLFYAYSYIPVKKIGNEINSMTITSVNNFIGGVILFVIVLFLPISLLTVNLSNIWLLLGYVILFSVFAIYLFTASLRKTKAWIVSSLLSISSVVGAAIGYFWLNETINAIQILGAVIILISSYFLAKK